MLSLDDSDSGWTAPLLLASMDGPGSLRRRLYHSLEHITVITQERCQIMQAWLEYLMSGAQTRSDPVVTSVAVRSDRGRLRWTALGHNPTLSNALHEIFAALEVDEVETAGLLDMLLTLEPPRLGAWLEVSGHGFDGGWVVHTPIPLAHAVRWSPACAGVGRLLVWAERVGVGACTRLCRCVSRQRAYTELHVPLPRLDGQSPAQVMAATAGALRIDAAGALTRALRGLDERSRVALTLRLSAAGAATCGAVVTDPSHEFISRLLSSASDADRAGLRAFEHSLSAVRPRSVTVMAMSDSVDVELHYTPYPTS